MSVISQLASSLGRRDEAPNQVLAQKIAQTRDRCSVQELVVNLSNADKNIQSDCIKVLYEIGERDPALISGYYEEFGSLLNHKNNRLVWGAMTALDAIAEVEPKGIYGFFAMPFQDLLFDQLILFGMRVDCRRRLL